jgi:nucleotide-binding universal stress UspA family protein
MTFLVPYDGSSLAKAALMRATEYADALEEEITVVTIIPDDQPYAEAKDWYDPTESEPFSVPYVTGKLHADVTTIAPGAAFRAEEIETGAVVAVANRIREIADEILPSVVFLGTDNVGEIAESVASVSGEVARDAEYDVRIVRHFSPTAVQAIPSDEEQDPIH